MPAFFESTTYIRIFLSNREISYHKKTLYHMFRKYREYIPFMVGPMRLELTRSLTRT